jgi:hypothetical protein
MVALLLLSLTCLSLCLWFYTDRLQWQEVEKQYALKKARKAAFQAVSEIDRTLKMVESAARSLAFELNSGRTHLGNLEHRMREISKTTPLIFGVGAAYQPAVLREYIEQKPADDSVASEGLLDRRGTRSTLTRNARCAADNLQPFMFAPYLKRNDKDHRQRDIMMVNKAYDYTCEAKYWYRCPLGLDPLNCPSANLDSWQEPYFGQASRRMVEEFSLPFYAPQMTKVDGAPSGTVWANMSLKDFKKLMSAMNFGQSGYGFMLSPTGKFIAHPNSDYIESAKTIEEEQMEEGDDLHGLFKRAAVYGTQVGQHIDPRSGKEAIWLFEPIHRTQWVLGLVYQKQDLLGKPRVERMQVILIALSLIGFLLFGSLFTLQLLTLDGALRYWSYSWCVSLYLLLAITSAWLTVINYPIYKDGNSISLDGNTKKSSKVQQHSHMIMSEWQIEQFQQRFVEKDLKNQAHSSNAPVFLPTGLFIQSLNFVDANSVKLTGYLWQRLPPDAEGCQPPQGDDRLGFQVKDNKGGCRFISEGVIFPEAKDIDTASPWPFMETYRQPNNDGGQTVGWYFDILMRERFDYQLYPFDVENVWLRMWHRDIGESVVLTPDLSAYPGFGPSSLPGLESDFVLPGWNLLSSFFDYKVHSYNTNFGLSEGQDKSNFPELHFNIILKRQFLGAFIGNLMPLLVVLVVLFALVLSTCKAQDMEIIGFSFSNVLASCAGLLFGVLIGHTELRAALDASGLVYMESFYLIMYLMLLLVILNAYVFAKYPDLSIVKWSDNLIAKLIFWPFLFGLILSVTLSQFYF